MARRTLIYRWDEQAGRMRLHSGNLRLSERDRVALESELRRHYESLLEQLDRDESNATDAFDAIVTAPRRVTGFRIRYSRGSRARCPELVLEPIAAKKAGPRRHKTPDQTGAPGTRGTAGADEPAASPCAARELAVRGNSPWVAGFMADVKRRLSETTPAQLTNTDRAAIAFTFAELQDLCRDRPDDLAVVLLAGYVSLGERMCDGADPDEARWYRSAARVLDQLCGRQIARDPDDAPVAQRVSADDRVGRLRRITRFLGRALGLQDEDDWE
jgi:hypothetical protein